MFSKNIQEVQESLWYINNPSALKVISLEWSWAEKEITLWFSYYLKQEIFKLFR